MYVIAQEKVDHFKLINCRANLKAKKINSSQNCKGSSNNLGLP